MFYLIWQMLLELWAGQIGGNWLFQIFDQNSKFLTMGRQHQAKFLAEIWKQIEFLKNEEDLVQEQNQDNKLKTRRMLYNHFWLDCIRKPDRGTLELRSFLDSNDQRQGKDGSGRYKGLENLIWWRMLFGIDSGLGSLISLVFKLRSSHRIKGVIGKMGITQGSRLTFLSC
jgi:hypothetical protein